MQSLKRRRLWLLVVVEWWRWVEMKVGFWIMDFHVLHTQMELMMDLIGNRRRIWVTISSGKESDIAACFQRE